MTVPGDKRALLAAIAGVRAAAMWRLLALGAGIGAVVAASPALALLHASAFGPALVLAGASIGAALAYRRTPTLQASAARLDTAFDLDELCVSAYAVACGRAHSERFGGAVMTRAVRALPEEAPWSRVVGRGGRLVGAGLAGAAVAISAALYLVALRQSPELPLGRVASSEFASPGVFQHTDVDKLPPLPEASSKRRVAAAKPSKPSNSSKQSGSWRDGKSVDETLPDDSSETDGAGAAGDADSSEIRPPVNKSAGHRSEALRVAAPTRRERVETGVAGTAMMSASVPQRYRPLVGAYLAGRTARTENAMPVTEKPSPESQP